MGLFDDKKNEAICALKNRTGIGYPDCARAVECTEDPVIQESLLFWIGFGLPRYEFLDPDFKRLVDKFRNLKTSY